MPKASSYVLATDREVQNSKPKGERAEFRVKGAANLVLRVSASGTKSWHFLYASPSSGQRRKLAFGTYPAMSLSEAKREALRLTLAVQQGRDPLAEWRIEQAADTFEELAGAYVHEHELKYARGGTRSGWTAEVSRLLNADILPAIGSLKAELVTKRHVMAVVETVAKREAYVTADRVLGIVRSIL